MDRLTRVLAGFVILTFSMFFILEAIFWMQPFVHDILLVWLDNSPKSTAFSIQAMLLKKLFVNQGFYNLFVAIEGMAGFYFINKNHATIGYAFLLFMCFSGVGAGIVLAFTTKAYLLAVLQFVPAAIAFYRIYPLFQKSL